MTKRFTLRATAVGFAVSGLLALAACGGDDDSSDTTTAPESTEQSADETTVPGGSETTEPAGSETTTGGDTPSGDCQALAQQFADAVGGVGNPSADPEELAEAFASLEENVPDDLKDDVSLIGGMLQGYADVYAKVKDDPAKAATDPDVLAALQEFSGQEYLTASGAISAYFTETCQEG